MPDNGVMSLNFAMTIEGLDDFKEQIKKLENVKLKVDAPDSRNTKNDVDHIKNVVDIVHYDLGELEDTNNDILNRVKSIAKDITRMRSFEEFESVDDQLDRIKTIARDPNVMSKLGLTESEVVSKLGGQEADAEEKLKNLMEQTLVKSMLHKMRGQEGKISEMTKILRDMAGGNAANRLSDLKRESKVGPSRSILEEILTGKKDLKGRPEFAIPGGLGTITAKTGSDIKTVKSVEDLKNKLDPNQLQKFLGKGDKPSADLMEKAFAGNLQPGDLSGVKLEPGKSYPTQLVKNAGKRAGVDKINDVSTQRRLNLFMNLTKQIDDTNIGELLEKIKSMKQLSDEGKKMIESAVERADKPFKFMQFSTGAPDRLKILEDLGDSIARENVNFADLLPEIQQSKPGNVNFDAMERKLNEVRNKVQDILNINNKDYGKDIAIIRDTLEMMSNTLNNLTNGKFGKAWEETKT